ncbi:MAG: phage holin family protein [Candidatus Shapirobacteria bacterium]
MKKILRFILIFIFALVAENQVWMNLTFQNQIVTLLKVAVVLSVFELLLKPIIKILLLPINILTLGLFRIVINTLGLYLATFLLADFSLQNIDFASQRWQGFTLPPLHFVNFFAYLITSLTIGLIFNIFNSILVKTIKKL